MRATQVAAARGGFLPAARYRMAMPGSRCTCRIRLLLTCLAALALALTAVPATACGFDGIGSVAVQRGVLNWVYPDALHVQGAVSMARAGGLLQPKHFAGGGGMLAFHRTAGDLSRLAGRLDVSPTRAVPAFSLVLLQPMLWSVFEPLAEGVRVRTHADRALAGSVVIVSDVPVVAAMVSGEVSAEAARAAGLLRFYGDANDVERLRAALANAFPAPDGTAIAANPQPGAGSHAPVRP
jgi:hypothetical protein